MSKFLVSLAICILIVFCTIGLSEETMSEECRHENVQRIWWNGEAFSQYCWDCSSPINALSSGNEIDDKFQIPEELKYGAACFIAVVGVAAGVLICKPGGSSYVQYLDWDE